MFYWHLDVFAWDQIFFLYMFILFTKQRLSVPSALSLLLFFSTAIFNYFLTRRSSIIKIFTQVDYYIFLFQLLQTFGALQPIIFLGADRSESDKTVLFLFFNFPACFFF